MARKKPEDRRDTFINCPFDEGYGPLFRALIFTIAACGYRPRCALEESDSGELRYEKLAKLIASCPLGIHDLSRVELSNAQSRGSLGTPRFNMPFELGLFLGARSYGGPAQRQKRVLILARKRQEWSPAISDLAGVDPEFHEDRPKAVVKAVRDFLHKTPDGTLLPGESALWATYNEFETHLAEAATSAQQTLEEAQRYRNYSHFLFSFLSVRADG